MKQGFFFLTTSYFIFIESYAGAQFEDVIKEIELHDKDRWLALRAKGGQAKRLLCLS